MFADRDSSRERQDSEREAPQGVQEAAESQRLIRCALDAFESHQAGRGLRYIEQAVQGVDVSSRSSVESRVAIRTEVVHTLILYNEPQEAERYLREASVLLATDPRSRELDVQYLRAWRAEVMLRSGNLGEALTMSRSVFDWARSNAPNSLLEVRALLVEAFVAAQQGTDQEYGAVMAQAFGTISVLKLEEMFLLSQVLASFSAAEEAQGRFLNAKLLAEAALKACEQSPERVVEAAQMLRAHEAQMYSKTGDFAGAKRINTALLKELVEVGGEHDPFALQVRISLAENCIEMSEFEAAESYLRFTLDTAREHEVFPMVWRAADVLLMLYSSRGMDEEAQEIQALIDGLQENLSESNQIINKADGSIVDMALNGDLEGALEELEGLFKKAEELEGSDAYAVETSLLATKAWVLASHRSEESREILNDVLDRLTVLPPEIEQSLRIKIAMTEAQLAVAEGKPEVACAVVQQELDGLTKREGQSSFNARGPLLFRLATLQDEAGFGDRAQKTARELVTLYTERKETGSIRYANSLILLARLLPNGADERSELVEQAVQLLQRRGLRLDDM
jgi:hypothetical protein